MVKKPFTTRLDESVLEMAQAIATAERRSITSVIELAVMDYAVKVEARRGALPVSGPEGGDWRLKLWRPDGARLPDRAFRTVDGMLAEARALTIEYPELKLVLGCPATASVDELEKARDSTFGCEPAGRGAP
jgi:hypothetical protein